MTVHPMGHDRRAACAGDAGFSMIELMVATAVLLVISGSMMVGIQKLTQMQNGISNRAAMHGGVRGAIELLQQEIGQAGSVTLPASVTLTSSVPSAGTSTVTVSSVAGMFAGEQLVVDTGANLETVTATTVNTASNSITASFIRAHASGVPVNAAGGFASGIVPTTATNGSSGTVLKLYGDVNDDGNMVYIEYTCDTAAGLLYRNEMAFDAASKPALTASDILLTNVLPNPNGTPCFSYQQKTVGTDTYVVDVAVTLTVQTQRKDPITNQYQTETAALLNISPRNVFDVWEMASLGDTSRVQPMPATVQNLLP
ncbi:MAG: prepilin-type N-terminal cleavage/methylation domain-containing protein [Acidobacteriota bacterium]|nr:prepilin-type N-terminal cleavage/methylation domain-containing protein [Acidobacteriota bacterium]